MPLSPFLPGRFLDIFGAQRSNVSDIVDPLVVEPSVPADENLWEENACPPVSMLEKFMDESYFQPILDDGDLHDTPGAYHTPDLSENPDQSSDSSYDIPQPYIQSEDLITPRSQDTIQGPPVVAYLVVHYERSPYFAPSPIKASKATGSPSSKKTASAKPAIEPHTSMSVYEKLTGSRRTSPTAREKESDRLAISQPSGITWTHSHGPFNQPSPSTENTPPSQRGLNDVSGHASRVETADRISRISFPVQSMSSNPSASTKSTLSFGNFFWIPVVPCSENLRLALGGKKRDDWDFSEIRDFACMDVSIRGRYREGMKGFLRVN
ncbi:MAG: hypothetical protein L6R38_000979 [Xanthoria sp. 2 TBL-2021]|nr:MAG: hypothetical protein L6R38_000979 [Xanthoria sp. 2 TBL-2021]